MTARKKKWKLKVEVLVGDVKEIGNVLRSIATELDLGESSGMHADAAVSYVYTIEKQ